MTYKQIEGVDPNLLSLDLYYSSSTEWKKPVVIYVHGGGWSAGDKANALAHKINLFRELNYVFVSINYRLSPFPYEPDNPERVQYPMHNCDVADAVRWVFDHIAQYGGDPRKIVLLGHSAGAHLVALTGTNATFLNGVGLTFSHIRGVAVIDTKGYDVRFNVEEGDRLYINAFGVDTTLNRQASPIYNVVAGVSYPRFFVAKRGDVDRIRMANDFMDTLRKNGVFVSEVDGRIYTHREINQAIGKPGEELMTNALKLFFEACFSDAAR
ncbi:MAG: carboxylesterase type B [Bacteroidetes bacterium]|nr:MAG: carboxylesterase type B [Bacteroidota bacterium]